MVLPLTWGKWDNMGYKHKATFEEQTQRNCWIPLLILQLYTTDTKGKYIISKNSSQQGMQTVPLCQIVISWVLTPYSFLSKKPTFWRNVLPPSSRVMGSMLSALKTEAVCSLITSMFTHNTIVSKSKKLHYAQHPFCKPGRLLSLHFVNFVSPPKFQPVLSFYILFITAFCKF